MPATGYAADRVEKRQVVKVPNNWSTKVDAQRPIMPSQLSQAVVSRVLLAEHGGPWLRGGWPRRASPKGAAPKPTC